MKLVLLHRRLDEVETPCLALPFCSDEKPLKGFCGLADWRLNGAISRQLEAARVTGAAGETVLVPSLERLSIRNFLLLGLGPAATVNPETYQASLARLVSTLRKAKLTEFVWAFNALVSAEIQAQALGEFLLDKGKDGDLWPVLVDAQQAATARSALKSMLGKRLTLEVLGTAARSEHKPFAHSETLP